MEITTLIAAVAAFGLPCSNPQLRDYPVEEMPWPAAYVRTIEGENIIAMREGIRSDTEHLPKILLHELLRCGLYEDRGRHGQPHPRFLDPREEMVVQAMTDVVLKRLNRNTRDGAWADRAAHRAGAAPRGPWHRQDGVARDGRLS